MPNFECVNSVRYKKHSKKRGLAADGPGRDETRKKESRGKGREGEGNDDGSSFSEPEARVLASNRVKRRRCGDGAL